MVRISAPRVLRLAGLVFTGVLIVWVRTRCWEMSDNISTGNDRTLPNIVNVQPDLDAHVKSQVATQVERLVVPSGRPPTLVLLISYQRSGSTYVCHLFKDASLLHKKNYSPAWNTVVPPGHSDPHHQQSADDFYDHVTNVTDHVFFLYEPLDALYTAMFGTQQGWNGADDIFNHDNGTQRILPKRELKAVTWYLEKILQCKMAELPPGILMQKFWNGFRGSMPLTDQFSSCIIKKTGIKSDWHLKNEECRKHIKHICGRYYGQKRYEQEYICHANLWGRHLEESDYLPNAIKYAWGMQRNITPGELRSEFRQYFQCMSGYTNATRQCAAEYFDRPCRTASVRAIKTVRAPMDVAKSLHDKYSNIKVIHSVRDPRALSNSRMHASWAVNAHGRKNITYISRNYCRNVHRDGLILNAMGRNRTYRILYDDFVRHPTKHLHQVYRFLGRDIPTSVTDEFMLKEEEKVRYIKRADKWQKELKTGPLANVKQQCSDFLTAMKQYHFGNFSV